jgi:hypothetical protein
MSAIVTGDTVCFKNLIRRSREYLVLRIEGETACLLSYCVQHITLTNIPIDQLVKRFNRFHRILNWVKQLCNKGQESYEKI